MYYKTIRNSVQTQRYLARSIRSRDFFLKDVGIILSGGPYSVYDEAAPHVDPEVEFPSSVQWARF